MKKLTLLFAVLISAATLFAQNETPDKINYGQRITGGTVMLSGSISYDKNLDDSEIFNLAFGGQLALTPRFAFYMGFGYRTQSNYINYQYFTFNNDRKDFSIMPGFSVFGKVGFGWLQPYLDIVVPIGFVTLNAGEQDEAHATSFSGVISPGLNIYLSKKVALTASMGVLRYSSIKMKDADEADDSISLGFSPADLSLGLVFLFGAK